MRTLLAILLVGCSPVPYRAAVETNDGGLNPPWTVNESVSPQTYIPNYLSGYENTDNLSDPRPDVSHNEGWNCADSDPTKGRMCHDVESHYVDQSGATQMEEHFTFCPPLAAPWNGAAHCHRWLSTVGRTEPDFAMSVFMHADTIQLGTGYGPNEPAMLEVYGIGSASTVTLKSYDGSHAMSINNDGVRFDDRGASLFFGDDSDYGTWRVRKMLPQADGSFDLGAYRSPGWARIRFANVASKSVQPIDSALGPCNGDTEGKLKTIGYEYSASGDSELWWCKIQSGNGVWVQK